MRQNIGRVIVAGMLLLLSATTSQLIGTGRSDRDEQRVHGSIGPSPLDLRGPATPRVALAPLGDVPLVATAATLDSNLD